MVFHWVYYEGLSESDFNSSFANGIKDLEDDEEVAIVVELFFATSDIEAFYQDYLFNPG